LVNQPESIYFENIVAKTIIFRTAEKIYGIKPNAIGDLRYITVPYSISLLTYKTGGKLDLYKIWKNQRISDQLKTLLYDLMVIVEDIIKKSAEEKHGALYGEWAKKEECWTYIKNTEITIDFDRIKTDIEDPVNPSYRKRIDDEESTMVQVQEELERIKTVPAEVWHKIEDWGKVTGELTEQKKTVAYNLAGRVRNNSKISEYERQTGNAIIDLVIEKAPELFEQIDEINEANADIRNKPEITLETIRKIVSWDKKHKKLKDFEYKFMENLVNGKKPLSERNKFIACLNLAKVKKYGFQE
jgi:hypothetical protein